MRVFRRPPSAEGIFRPDVLQGAPEVADRGVGKPEFDVTYKHPRPERLTSPKASVISLHCPRLVPPSTTPQTHLNTVPMVRQTMLKAAYAPALPLWYPTGHCKPESARDPDQ